MWVEIILIFVFILFNGFFAGSEIAVVTARKTRISELVKEGNKKALILKKLQSDPDRFLATVQIGVTVVGAMASAIGGATAIKLLQPIIEKVPIKLIAASSDAISIGVVVILISYLSLVIGELVPKSIALKNPERVALIVARPLSAFSRITSYFVSILTFSTNLILKPLGTNPFTQRSFVSEEEIKLLIKEGRDRGLFEPEEEELIHGVFEFADLSVKQVMVPFTKVVAFSIDTPLQEILDVVSEEQYSRYPVYHKETSNIKGILYAKDLFKKLSAKESIDISKLVRAPFFVPESMKISTLLRQMQRRGTHIAVVVDEYGAVTGIVTIEDLIEEIVGEIRDEYDVEQPVIKLRDGSFLIDASIAIRDLKEDHGIELPVSPDYDTLGGFVITSLQRIPSIGETFTADGWKIKITEMIGKRIARVILNPADKGTTVQR
ncbi:magnesium and cobalt efflux protein CorC [bacterium BMS3Abin08]|nr:magnesium and cobalt efflux protein CorC [bacterium BMS3Abin08]